MNNFKTKRIDVDPNEFGIFVHEPSMNLVAISNDQMDEIWILHKQYIGMENIPDEAIITGIILHYDDIKDA